VNFRYRDAMAITASECIVSYHDDYGFVFIYEHTDDEPHETLLAATAIAMNVAAEQAVKEGKTCVVASTTVPSYTVFGLPFGHPLIAKRALSIMNQLMPDGQRIRMPKPQKH
jgi:hypothetical protein